jgi:hypothetical protein
MTDVSENGRQIATVDDALKFAQDELGQVKTVHSDDMGHLLNAVHALKTAIEILARKPQ